MWIKRITLENFQSHPFTTIEFSPSINVFLGRGNRGKTAIIRAILWVFFNEPQGTFFVRKGKSVARVTITLNDGTTVIREKGKGINRYILITNNGDRKEYSGFGKDIPQEIKDALKIKILPIEHGRKLSPQIKEQMDSLYLLDESPSTIHTTLLTISGGHVIDEALKSLATDIVRVQRRKKEVLNDIEDLKSSLETYKGIDKKRDRLLKLKAETDNLKILLNKRDRLIQLKGQIKSIEMKLRSFKRELRILEKVEIIEGMMSRVDEERRKLYELKKIKKKYVSNREDFIRVNKLYKLLDKDTIREETIGEINKLKDLYVSITKIKLEAGRLEEKIRNFKKEKANVENTINRLIEKYVGVIGREGVCPVCLREVDETLMEKVKENIKRLWR